MDDAKVFKDAKKTPMTATDYHNQACLIWYMVSLGIEDFDALPF